MGKQLKVGVRRGGGPPPGYRWHVWIVDLVLPELMDFLNSDEYQHFVFQFKGLAAEVDPSHSLTSSVDAIEDFYELRDKGGVLGKLNVRIFFHLDKQHSAIVVLGGIKKQNDGSTPSGAKRRMSRRRRKYLNGDYGSSEL
jgi:hypothetical protein